VRAAKSPCHRCAMPGLSFRLAGRLGSSSTRARCRKLGIGSPQSNVHFSVSRSPRPARRSAIERQPRPLKRRTHWAVVRPLARSTACSPPRHESAPTSTAHGRKSRERAAMSWHDFSSGGGIRTIPRSEIVHCWRTQSRNGHQDKRHAYSMPARQWTMKRRKKRRLLPPMHPPVKGQWWSK